MPAPLNVQWNRGMIINQPISALSKGFIATGTTAFKQKLIVSYNLLASLYDKRNEAQAVFK